VADQLKRARSNLDKRAPVTLENDPKTEVYRPKGSGE
jgi:hypothetical protein